MIFFGGRSIWGGRSLCAHDVLAGDLSRSMQKDPTDYDAFSSALAESPFYKDELARRGLTPEAYRTSIEQAVKKTSGVGLPKEQAQYEAAMRFAKEVLFEDPAAIARMKQTDPELFSKVKAWTERVHARLSGSSQENAANALWSMYDKADGGSGSGGGTGGSGRTDGPELPPTGDPERGNARTFDADGGREEETAPPANEETVAHEKDEGYNEEKEDKLQPLENGPYIKNGKPNGRPGPTGREKLKFEQEVYNRCVGADGVLRDPNTGERISWRPGQARKGIVDFGHTQGKSYQKMFKKYKNREITLKQLKEFQSNPENFRLETPSANRSHEYE